LWADGTTARSDGLTWLCSDLGSDFTHPSSSGISKVADQLLAFFKTDPTATPWFLKAPTKAPTLTASATPASGTHPIVVNFTATGTPSKGRTIKEYDWTFDDGGYAFSTQNPTKTYPVAGTYNAHVTVSDSGGDTTTQTVTVTVT